MKRFTIRGSFLLSAGVLTMVLASLAPFVARSLAQAQAPANTISLVRVSQVKPEMAPEYLAIQKNEVVPALKKAGIASRTFLQTVLGNPYEYVSTIPLPHYAMLDDDTPLVKALGKDGTAKLLAKLNRCVASQSAYLTTRVEALSARPQNPASIWISARYRVTAGRTADYEDFLKTEILPVYAKAKAAGKIAGYSVSRRGVGSNTRDRVTIVYANKIADMEAGNPLTQILGAEAAAKLAAKGATLASMVEVIVRRRVPDLSF